MTTATTPLPLYALWCANDFLLTQECLSVLTDRTRKFFKQFIPAVSQISLYPSILPSVTQLITGEKYYQFIFVNKPSSGLSYLRIGGKNFTSICLNVKLLPTVLKHDRPYDGLVLTSRNWQCILPAILCDTDGNNERYRLTKEFAVLATVMLYLMLLYKTTKKHLFTVNTPLLTISIKL
jgi:hypothetical protein